MFKALRSSRSRSNLKLDSPKEPTTPTRRSKFKQQSAMDQRPGAIPPVPPSPASPARSRKWQPRPLSIFASGIAGSGLALQSSAEDDVMFGAVRRPSTPSLVSDSSTASRSPYGSMNSDPTPRLRTYPFGPETTINFSSPSGAHHHWIKHSLPVHVQLSPLDPSWAAAELAQHAVVRSALGLSIEDVPERSPSNSDDRSPGSTRCKLGEGSGDSDMLRTEDSIGRMLAASFPLPPSRSPPPVPPKSNDAPSHTSSTSSSATATATDATRPSRDSHFKGPVVRLSQVSDSSDLARRRRRARSTVNQADVPGLPTTTTGDATCSGTESTDSVSFRPLSRSSVMALRPSKEQSGVEYQSTIGQRPKSRLGSLPYLGHRNVRTPSTATAAGSGGLVRSSTPDSTMATPPPRSSSTPTPAMKTAKSSLPWLPYLRKPSGLFASRAEKTDRGAWSTPTPCIPLPETPRVIPPLSAGIPMSPPNGYGCCHSYSMACSTGCSESSPSSLSVGMAPGSDRPRSPSTFFGRLDSLASSEGGLQIPPPMDVVPGQHHLRPAFSNLPRRPSLTGRVLKRPSLGVRKVSSSPSLRDAASLAADEVESHRSATPCPSGNSNASPLSRIDTCPASPDCATKPRSKLIPHSMSFARLRSRFLGDDKALNKSSTPEPVPASVKARVRWYEKRAQESSDSIWGTSRRMGSLDLSDEMTAPPGPSFEGQAALTADSLQPTMADNSPKEGTTSLPIVVSPFTDSPSPNSLPSQEPSPERVPKATPSSSHSPSSSASHSPAETTSSLPESSPDQRGTKDSPFQRPCAPLPPVVAGDDMDVNQWSPQPSATPRDATHRSFLHIHGDGNPQEEEEEEEGFGQTRLCLRPTAPLPPPAMSFDSLWTVSSASSSTEAFNGPDFDVVPSNETGQLGLRIGRMGGGRARATSNVGDGARPVRSSSDSQASSAAWPNRWSLAAS